MADQRKADYLEAADVEPNQWDTHPSDEDIEETVANLEAHGFEVDVVADAEEALDVLKAEIPDGASVMNGHSTTLEEIGFMEHLHEGDHAWENLHDHVGSIDDEEARAAARREAQTADYFLGGANGIAKTGALVAADASGSRVGAYPFAAKHLLVVAGVNKIEDDIETARDRLEEYAYRLEDERAQDAYDVGSAIAKELVYRREQHEGRTTVVLVEETLGY